MSEPEGQTAEESRPWERPGAVRRDCEPHRGGVLMGLGAAALAVSIVPLPASLYALLEPPRGGAVFALLWSAGVALGLAASALARRDLAEIEAGRMDPEGRRAAAEARHRAFLAGAVSLVALLAGAPLLLAAWLL